MPKQGSRPKSEGARPAVAEDKKGDYLLTICSCPPPIILPYLELHICSEVACYTAYLNTVTALLEYLDLDYSIKVS